jgi:excisionase family DNA binding protein
MKFKESARTTATVVPAAMPVTSVVNPEPVLTPEQIAGRLQLTPSTIYEFTRRRNKRPLPAMRAGKYLRFYWSEVEQWLKGDAA